MKSLIQRSSILPKPVVLVLAVALVALIGIVDQRTGWEFQVGAFYLIPIVWACWLCGRRAGFFLAGVATVAWLIADSSSRYVYQHPAIPYWNALMLLSFFLVVVGLLAAFQSVHYRLEEIVHQRTAALQTEIAERKRLERANLQAERLAAVGAMATQVAHEIRNPLGSITLNLDLVSKEIDRLAATSQHPPAEGRVLVGEIREESRRIQTVVEEYLAFARPPKLNRYQFNLNDLLDQKLTFMNATFHQAGIQVRREFDAGLPLLQADAEQLWQAILNLIRNALDAMPDGGTLTITTKHIGGDALVRVTDTGVGMTKEQLAKVYQPFFTTKASGTGLGLALVQQIITEHGGHLECDSEPGQGSTFTISLPLPTDA